MSKTLIDYAKGRELADSHKIMAKVYRTSSGHRIEAELTTHLPQDVVITVAETREDKDYFDKIDLSKEIEKHRQLLLFERQTGGKHELADLEL